MKPPALWRAVGWGLVVALAILLVQQLAFWLSSDWARDWAFGKGDLTGYLEGARRFLDIGSPYAPWTGLGPHTFIHPPVALALFVPFLWLPAVLWWVVPLVGTALLLGRPANPWRIVAILACLAWPRSIGAILAGNSDIWVMFFVALGLRFGWPMALLAMKPTFLPLAVVRWRSWKAGVVLALASLVLLPLWIQWFGIVRQIDGGFVYSLGGLPLVCLPLLTGDPSLIVNGWRRLLRRRQMTMRITPSRQAVRGGPRTSQEQPAPR